MAVVLQVLQRTHLNSTGHQRASQRQKGGNMKGHAQALLKMLRHRIIQEKSESSRLFWKQYLKLLEPVSSSVNMSV